MTLSYRGSAYSRARGKNRERFAQLLAAGRIDEMLSSRVVRIEDRSVAIASGDELTTIANDDVIVCAGGILPTGFLQEIGIGVETKFGTV